MRCGFFDWCNKRHSCISSIAFWLLLLVLGSVLNAVEHRLQLTLLIFYLFVFDFNRHVILPKELAKNLPKSRLLTESEWRGIGVQQSRGWQHYAIHRYVVLFYFFW